MEHILEKEIEGLEEKVFAKSFAYAVSPAFRDSLEFVKKLNPRIYKELLEKELEVVYPF